MKRLKTIAGIRISRCQLPVGQAWGALCSAHNSLEILGRYDERSTRRLASLLKSSCYMEPICDRGPRPVEKVLTEHKTTSFTL